MIIGFFDESAPQTSSNAVRLWSFNKPEIMKDTSKYRANTFGFYSLNGKSVVSTYANSKQESVIDFLRKIREENPFNNIFMILDNFSAHRTERVTITAETLDIHLVFLPPYSPQLNPIELIWKSIKRIVSRTFVKDQDMLIDTVKRSFLEFAESKSFCRKWVGSLSIYKDTMLCQ